MQQTPIANFLASCQYLTIKTTIAARQGESVGKTVVFAAISAIHGQNGSRQSVSVL
jgi:hypothetical protein